ncbi:FRG domain-containing protein [Lacrimispora indolis]|uniref:FRG domain-containing protein n=1 Tax=Lacrimispora indolis TaxID=69825 RepID=UPI00045E92A3|nr:FRG domain-containing protein [Lacrimispora indolis]
MKKPKVLGKNNIRGTIYVDDFKFSSGHSAPIYEVFDCHGLNKIIGYAKLLNQEYGKVYYRGQCNLYESLLPSLFHEKTNKSGMKISKLKKIINASLNDKKFSKEIHLNKDNKNSYDIIEGMLQHYGINTRCIDAVDNHWIALWFGLNKYYCQSIGKITYATYINRIKNNYSSEMITRILKGDDPLRYQYVMLIAADSNEAINGVENGNDIITIDLRIALPSTFLRPHAQHAIILKKRLHDNSCDYDISRNVVGILKVRNDIVYSWLGDGELVKFNNLFPSPFYDNAYRILLQRDDLFNDGKNSIVRYTYD